MSSIHSVVLIVVLWAIYLIFISLFKKRTKEKNMVGVEAKPLKKVNKPYKIRREGSFVSGFK